MLRMPKIRLVTYAALAGIAPPVAGLAWLLGAVIAEGRELSAVEDVVLDLLIGVVGFLALGWLVLRRRSRGEERYRQEIDAGTRKLDTAISHMSQGLVMFDASHRIVMCNRRYLELYDLSPAVVKPGLLFRDLLLHRKESGSFFGDVDEYCNTLMAVLSRGITRNHIIKSSRGRLVRIVNEPLEYGGWVVTHEDVTERQQLLEAHEQSEKIVGEQKLQLDVALNNMTHGLCMFDAEGRIVLFNRRYSEMMGESAEYLRGLSLLDLFKHRKAIGTFRGDPDEFFSGVMTSMREGKPTVREMVRVDGIALRVVDQPMEGGGWVATYEDVTEQRRTERDRDRNRAFLDLIIDNVPSAIFVKNAVDRRYVLVNRAGEQFWGVSRQAMIGKTAGGGSSGRGGRQHRRARRSNCCNPASRCSTSAKSCTRSGGIRSIHSRRLLIRDGKSDAGAVCAGRRRRRDRAEGRRGKDRPARALRPADRSSQPHAVSRAARKGALVCAAGRPACGALSRSRPLQEHQRYTWAILPATSC